GGGRRRRWRARRQRDRCARLGRRSRRIARRRERGWRRPRRRSRSSLPAPIRCEDDAIPGGAAGSSRDLRFQQPRISSRPRWRRAPAMSEAPAPRERGGPGMYIGLSDEQQKLVNDLRSYYAQLLTPEVRAAIAQEHATGPRTTEVRKQIARDGWLCFGWPKDYGGQGRGEVDHFLFFDE